MSGSGLTALAKPSRDDDDAIPISRRGPADKDIVAAFGFWLFLLSDIVIFAGMFAAYAVLVNQTAGGPSGAQLFNRAQVFIETMCLLASSFTCGLMSIGIDLRNKTRTYGWATVTFLLGAVFVTLEVREFVGMIANGVGPSRSAFLSAFFTLVGTHGIHVTIGLVSLIVMMAQVATLGFQPIVMRRLRCFSLFWHALDIVWVGVFTIVYLGVR
jgi:cytochrome o ubiquinol oxidase subunit 3